MYGLPFIEIIYWASTIIGGTLFILRLGTMLYGGDISDDGLDASLGAGDGAIDHADTDASFKLLSVQGLTSFFMMFGLVGLALLRANFHIFITVIGGTIAGLITVGITGFIFSKMRGLQSEGTIHPRNAIGSKGNIYLTIPENGTGQVQVVVQGALKIFDAVSIDKKKVSTGEAVEITGIESETILIVKKTS